MKVVVVYKWSRNAADALVRSDGSIDWRNAKMSAGEDDPAALAVASRLASDSGGEVVGLTVGDGEASWALARGVSSAVSVSDATHLIDNAATASLLAAAVRTIADVDVVVIGDSKQDSGVPVALAGDLGWPALVGLLSAEVVDGKIRATRREGAETVVFEVAGPVVLGIAAEADVDKVPGMKERLAARKHPVQQLTIAGLGLDVADMEQVAWTLPESTPTRVFEGDPANAASQLIDALKAEGVL